LPENLRDPQDLCYNVDADANIRVGWWDESTYEWSFDTIADVRIDPTNTR